jgi:hypothetical protein
MRFSKTGIIEILAPESQWFIVKSSLAGNPRRVLFIEISFVHEKSEVLKHSDHFRIFGVLSLRWILAVKITFDYEARVQSRCMPVEI